MYIDINLELDLIAVFEPSGLVGIERQGRRPANSIYPTMIGLYQHGMYVNSTDIACLNQRHEQQRSVHCDFCKGVPPMRSTAHSDIG